jgi:protein gp37
LIAATPWLDWLLLTKRPENIGLMAPWKDDNWPDNVWLGTTVESQEYADLRLPHMLKHKAAVRFVSCEPLLGPLDLSGWFNRDGFQPLDWVISGGESGIGARPVNPAWVERLLDQCHVAQVAFHFKQWGNWSPVRPGDKAHKRKLIKFADGSTATLVRRSKKESGRVLRGRTWDGFPTAKRLTPR